MAEPLQVDTTAPVEEGAPPYVVLLNPLAGAGEGARIEVPLRAALAAAGMAHEVYHCDSAAVLQDRAREAALNPTAALIVVGGDGAISAAVNGLIQATLAGGGYLPIGILPAGRHNDLATMIGLPTTPTAAVARWQRGRTIRVDVGAMQAASVETRYFVNAVGLGLVAQYTYAQERHRFFRGRVRDFFSLLLTTLQADLLPVTITVDGRSRRFTLFDLTIGIGAQQVGHFRLTPRASLNDGKFDLCLIGDLGRSDLLRLLWRSRQGHHRGHSAVTLSRGRQVRVHCEQPLPLHVDGEPWESRPGQAIDFELLPERLAILI